MLFASSWSEVTFYNLNSTVNRKKLVCNLFYLVLFFHSNYYFFIYAFLPFILYFCFPLFVLMWNITFLWVLPVATYDCCFWSQPVTIDECFYVFIFVCFVVVLNLFCVWMEKKSVNWFFYCAVIALSPTWLHASVFISVTLFNAYFSVTCFPML